MDKLLLIYEGSLRAAFFSTFLSLAGFIFGAKTFILIKLKEGLHDGGAYKRVVRKAQGLGVSVDPFGGLRRAHRFLAASVAGCVGTAILQVTLGVVGSPWTALVCVIVAAFAIVVLVVAIYVVNVNLKDWINEVERRAKEDVAAEEAGFEEGRRQRAGMADCHVMD